MQKYKSAFQMKTVFSAFLALCLSACVKPKTKSLSELEAEGAGPNAESSAFYNSEVTGKISAMDIKTSWGIPASSKFSFSTCMKDKRTTNSLRYAPFEVEGGPSVIQTKTDGDGCLTWTEDVPFNFFSAQKYLTLSRSLHSKGLQRGSRNVKIAVYPWNMMTSSTNTEVLDLNFHPSQIPANQIVNSAEDLKSALNDQAKDGSLQKRPLQIDDMRILTQDLNTATQGKNIALTLSFSTQVKLVTLGGNPTHFTFKTGKVKVSVALLSTKPEKQGDKLVQVRKMLGRADSNDVFVADVNDSNQGVYRVQLPLHLAEMVMLDQLEMVVKITPVDSPAALDSFEGVFALGSFADINGGSFHSTIPKYGSYKTEDTAFSFDQYVGSSKSYSRSGLTSGEAVYDPYVFSILQVTFDHIDRKKAPTASHRTLDYKIRACVQNADGSLLKGISFAVTNTDGIQVQPSLKTDELGCMVWNEQIENQYYKPEKYIYKNVTLKAENGFTKTLTVRLDPWSEKGGNFGADLRSVGPQNDDAADNDSGSPSRVYLNQFSLTQIRDAYDIDKYLNITKHRTVQISFTPQVERYSSLTNSFKDLEYFTPGRYLLKYGLRTEPNGLAYPETISTGHSILTIPNTFAIQAIDLPITDLRQVNVRSQFYLEIYPLDESKAGSMKDEDIFKAYPNTDDLIDKNAGLLPRTFVGATQPGLSVNSSSMVRPVDDLQQSFCGRVDCSALKTTTVSAGQGAVAFDWPTDLRLTYRNVNELAEREKVLKAARDQQNQRALDPKVLAATMNASVLTLSSSKGNDFLSATKLTTYQIQTLLKGQVNKDGVEALCGAWVYSILPHVTPAPKSLSFLAKSQIYAACRSYYRPKVLQNANKISTTGLLMNNPFLIDRKLKVLEARYNREAAINTPLDFVPGTSFSASYSDGVTYGWSTSAGAGANANLSFGSPDSVPQGPAQGPMSAHSGAEGGAGIFGNIGMSVSRSGSSSQSTSTSYGVSAQKSLNVDQIQMPLTVTRYQRCAMLGLNPDFIRDNLGLMAAFLGFSEAEKNQMLTHKVLLCDGEETKPLATSETYYVITSSGTSVTDQGNLNNLPFVAELRGVADFAKFAYITAGSLSPRDVAKKQEAFASPFDKLNKAYLNESVSYPGYISVP